MRSIKPPILDSNIFLKCVAELSLDDAALVDSVKDDVQDRIRHFNAHAKASSLGSLSKRNYGQDVSAALKQMYECFSSRASMRTAYNQIRASAYGYCPYCGVSEVSSLDHFLPKARWPELAVAPLNLVPSCTLCNSHKLEWTPSSDSDVLFFPYVDDWHGRGIDLIEAEIQWTDRPSARGQSDSSQAPAGFNWNGGPTARFRVTDSQDVPAEIRDRLRFHVKRLHLLDRWAALSGDRIVTIGLSLSAHEGGASLSPLDVRALLVQFSDQELNGRDARGWHRALLLALAEDVRYCESFSYESSTRDPI